jgi:hypothetical protein
MQSYLVPCLLRKLEIWNCESEWRIAKMHEKRKSCGCIKKTDQYANCGKPTKIFLGAKMEPEIKAIFYALFSEDKEIEVREMIVTPYGLEEKPYVRH